MLTLDLVETGMNVVRLLQPHTFEFFTISNVNMVDAQTFEMGMTFKIESGVMYDDKIPKNVKL
jgi:hypothetical protein